MFNQFIHIILYYKNSQKLKLLQKISCILVHILSFLNHVTIDTSGALSGFQFSD
jgi:hypothetical protein